MRGVVGDYSLGIVPALVRQTRTVIMLAFCSTLCQRTDGALLSVQNIELETDNFSKKNRTNVQN